MAWTERAKSSASFSNRPDISAFVRVGDLGLDNPIFVGLSFDDIVPGTGKTLGELTFDDLIRVSIWSPTPSHATLFTNHSKSA